MKKGKRTRAIALVGLALIACGAAAWALVPRATAANGRDCGVPAVDAMRDTAGMSERVAEIMGGEDGRRFFCKRDGRRTLGEAALGILVAASLLAGVVSFVALRTSSEEDPYGPREETVERE